MKLYVTQGGTAKVIEGTDLLVATGRTPNTEGIGLELAGEHPESDPALSYAGRRRDSRIPGQERPPIRAVDSRHLPSPYDLCRGNERDNQTLSCSPGAEIEEGVWRQRVVTIRIRDEN